MLRRCVAAGWALNGARRLRLASAAPSQSFSAGNEEGEAAAVTAEGREEDVPHMFITMPAFSDDTIKARVTEWMHEEGAWMEADSALCEVETHEIIADVDVDRSGFLAKILVPAGGASVPVGEDLAIVVEKEEHVALFDTWGELEVQVPQAGRHRRRHEECAARAHQHPQGRNRRSRGRTASCRG